MDTYRGEGQVRSTAGQCQRDVTRKMPASNRRTCPDHQGSLTLGPFPAADSNVLSPPTPGLQLPHPSHASAHTTHPFPSPLPCLRFPLPELPPFIDSLTLRHQISNIRMRRALAAGLVLYLGLGRVLSSPTQAPFELNDQNISNVENASASESQFRSPRSSFFPLLRGVPVLLNVSRLREPRLIQAIVIQGHHGSYKDDSCISQTSIRTLSIESEVQCPVGAIGKGQRRKKTEPDTLGLHTSS